MNPTEALQALYAGKKIRDISWSDKTTYIVVENNDISRYWKNQKAEKYVFSTLLQSSWEEYVESKWFIVGDKFIHQYDDFEVVYVDELICVAKNLGKDNGPNCISRLVINRKDWDQGKVNVIRK
jgi:dipeptidyl aminopeptidase/acylaminoacyl peptidase